MKKRGALTKKAAMQGYSSTIVLVVSFPPSPSEVLTYCS